MLNRKLRFHSRGGVRYTYQHGKTIRTPKISLVHADNSRGRQRFAVVVSKKVAKSAVKRNRIRRRVYEALRLIIKEQNFSAPKDLIFVIYSKDIATIPFQEVKALLQDLLAQQQK